MYEVRATCTEDELSKLASELGEDGCGGAPVEPTARGWLRDAERRSSRDAERRSSRDVKNEYSGINSDPRFEAFGASEPEIRAISHSEDVIGLVRRGVRIAPFAETTPLLPLYAASGQELPAELRVAASDQEYEFYLVSLTFSLRLDDDEFPDHAEFVVKVHDDVSGPRATRAIEVFPARVHTSYFKATGRLSVGVKASMKFAVGAEGFPAGNAAQADVDATAEGKLLVGPFNIDIGQTELTVSGEGDREIGWVYRVNTALEGKNDFKSFLVLKVAKETPKVDLLANIGVRTYRRTWQTLWLLRDRLPVLHAKASLGVELLRRAQPGASNASG